MKKLFLVLLLAVSGIAARAQHLYTKTFGDPQATPILFLHGGPGYNAAIFEATTAGPLATAGYFVIVYDRRGEGRSADPAAAYTFAQTFDDLQEIYNRYHLTRATLMGHSFGGIVATLFARTYPEKIQTLILVSAPVSLQQSFKNILTRSTDIYRQKADSVNLRYMDMIRKMDTSSLMYSSYTFMHAMQNGFYTPSIMDEEARSIYTTLRRDTLFRYTSQMTQAAPAGFWKNEQYTTLDLSTDLQALKAKKTHVYAFYGKDDGLYAPQQVAAAAAIVGPSNLLYLDHCSHNVFIDQQAAFIAAVKRWLN